MKNDLIQSYLVGFPDETQIHFKSAKDDPSEVAKEFLTTLLNDYGPSWMSKHTGFEYITILVDGVRYGIVVEGITLELSASIEE